MPSELDRGSRHDAVERALTTANVHRRRGDWEAAWRALDDALVMAPEHPPLLEMMGQLNLDEDQHAAAVQCFRRALELEPGRPAAELGFATATLLLKEAEAGVGEAPDPILAGRQPSDAMLRSTLVPGMGQAYAGEVGRGVAFLVPWLLLWSLLVWFVTSAGQNLRSAPSVRQMSLLAALPPVVWVLGALLFVCHLASGIDAGRLLRRVTGQGGEGGNG